MSPPCRHEGAEGERQTRRLVVIKRGVEQRRGLVPRQRVFDVLAGDGFNDERSVGYTACENPWMIDERRMTQDASARQDAEALLEPDNAAIGRRPDDRPVRLGSQGG